MFDIDTFIELVKECDLLWDKKHAGYSDRNLRERVWVDIGVKFYSDWFQVDAETKEARVKEMKSKWRNLRDAFLRSVNTAGKKGDPAGKKKKYVHSEQLRFLINSAERRQATGKRGDDSAERRETTGNMTDGSDEEDPLDEPTLDPGISPVIPPTSVTPALLPRPRPSACSKKNPEKLTTFQSELLKKLDKTPEQEELDADKMFLLSLLPDVKALSDDDKYDFKIMNLQFLRERAMRLNTLSPQL